MISLLCCFSIFNFVPVRDEHPQVIIRSQGRVSVADIHSERDHQIAHSFEDFERIRPRFRSFAFPSAVFTDGGIGSKKEETNPKLDGQLPEFGNCFCFLILDLPFEFFVAQDVCLDLREIDEAFDLVELDLRLGDFQYFEFLTELLLEELLLSLVDRGWQFFEPIPKQE